MTKSQKFYSEIILSAISTEDRFAGREPTDAEKLAYAWSRYFSEIGEWREQQTTRLESVQHWFQGLALNVPYMNYEILELAKDAGLLPEDATEKKEDAFLERYWQHLAAQFIILTRPYQ